jgi:hypothetical protein
MNELLQRLRGQSSALTLLLKAFDSSSIAQILEIVQSGQQTFQTVRKGTASIRSSHPPENYAESILDLSFDDTKTIYSVEHPEVVEPPETNDPISAISSSLSSTTISPSSKAYISNDGIPEGWVARYYAEFGSW